MTEGLTARQTQILKALIDEYMQTAEPVGSESLDKKYTLGISPATIRNEMVTLTKVGYLRQPHTSAGRIPSPSAMKFYIDQLMEERQMSLTEEVKAKEEVWDARGDINRLLEEATHALAERTRNLAVTTTAEGRVWQSGFANIFANPEFADVRDCASLFTFIEQAERLHQLFFERALSGSPIDVLFGEELDWPEIAPVAIVATHFRIKDKDGVLAVIGPARLSYPTVIPVIRYFKNLIEEIAGA